MLIPRFPFSQLSATCHTKRHLRAQQGKQTQKASFVVLPTTSYSEVVFFVWKVIHDFHAHLSVEQRREARRQLLHTAAARLLLIPGRGDLSPLLSLQVRRARRSDNHNSARTSTLRRVYLSRASDILRFRHRNKPTYTRRR